VMNSEVMRRALEYAAMFGKPVVSHCEDAHLTKGAAMNEGPVATELGLRGWPAVAESAMAARDAMLSRWTGGHVHIAHVSAKETVEVIRAAKVAGARVTAEASPHHLTLDDQCLRDYDPRFKMNPPLRSAEDVQAVVAALADGTLDGIASDHAPHGTEEKEQEFAACPYGVVGLETTLGVILTDLVAEGKLTANRAIEAMTVGPARVLGLPHGTLAPGAAADVTIIDPNRKWKVDPAKFRSRGRCTPWEGRTLKGAAAVTIVDGRIVFESW
jgi:dihydroorotase